MATSSRSAPRTPARSSRSASYSPIQWSYQARPPGCVPTPPGSRIVTAAWLNGMGLPDNDGANNNTTAEQRGDRRSGLLLSKNGLTTDCSSAGAEIKGVRDMTVTATFELGFDYRNGGHCSGGSPRFNVTARSASGE